MVLKNIPQHSGYMTCKSLGQAQRDNTPRISNRRKCDERNKTLKDEFIAPTICKNL